MIVLACGYWRSFYFHFLAIFVNILKENEI